MTTADTMTIADTATRTILARHDCDWDCDAESGRGHCACGLTVNDEDQWTAHTSHAIVAELWTPAMQPINSENAVDALPVGTTVLARPGRDNRVCRRTQVGWMDLAGHLWASASLLPVLVLDGTTGGTP